MSIQRLCGTSLQLCTIVLALVSLADTSAAQTFEITDYGAVGNAVSDDGPAIQAAVDAAGVNGGVVHIPAGTYRLATAVTLPSGVTLRGVGWQGSTSATARKGSWLLIDRPDCVPLTLSGNGVGIERLAFVHQHPYNESPFWLPGDFPFTIEIVGDDADRIRLRDLLLLNPTLGIRQVFTGQADGAGALYVDGIYGQPIKVGIQLERLTGSAFIQNVKFDTRWSTDPDILDYMANHLEAIVIERAERPSLQNVSAAHAHTGLVLSGNSSGVAERVRVSNFDCSPCRSGIEVTADGVSAKVANLTLEGLTPPPLPYSVQPPELGHGLSVPADRVELLLEGIQLTGVDLAGITVGGDDSVVTIDGLTVKDWNGAGQGHYALEIAHSGAQILVGFNHVLDGPLGLIANDPARVIFDL